MNRFVSWARMHQKPLFLGVTVTMMALGIVSVVLSMGSSDPEADAAQVAATKVELALAREQAELNLATAHETLLADLPGMDAERVKRDEAIVRSFVLTLAGTSTSSRTTGEEQASLDARYEALDEESRLLTEFLPEWIVSTKGTQFTLAELDTQVSGIKGLTYSYSAVARLDPVGDQGRAQYIFLTMTTSQDGTITATEAYRVTNSSRNTLIEDEKEATQPSDGGEIEN